MKYLEFSVFEIILVSQSIVEIEGPTEKSFLIQANGTPENSLISSIKETFYFMEPRSFSLADIYTFFGSVL